ncbi:MAG: hypothetical protein AVDCRST_MAG45-1190, partial [uncultured Solirubrobacterales bacterium]
GRARARRGPARARHRSRGPARPRGLGHRRRPRLSGRDRPREPRRLAHPRAAESRL